MGYQIFLIEGEEGGWLDYSETDQTEKKRLKPTLPPLDIWPAALDGIAHNQAICFSVLCVSYTGSGNSFCRTQRT